MSPRYPIWSIFFSIGARLTTAETLTAFVTPLCYAFLEDERQTWLLTNAVVQLLIFMPIVIIPAMLTGHMAYVDIGWPSGLVALGMQGLRSGQGFWLRRLLMGGCIAVHGARMVFGAMVLFYPYVWPKDLPRQQTWTPTLGLSMPTLLSSPPASSPLKRQASTLREERLPVRQASLHRIRHARAAVDPENAARSRAACGDEGRTRDPGS